LIFKISARSTKQIALLYTLIFHYFTINTIKKIELNVLSIFLSLNFNSSRMLLNHLYFIQKKKYKVTAVSYLSFVLCLCYIADIFLMLYESLVNE